MILNYLHHSDILSNKLVATPFDGFGFGEWKRAMLIALSAKNKVGFIDGSFPKPFPTAQIVKYWQRCNDTVFSWILNNVSPEISNSIIFSTSAHAVWSELEERFGKSNGAQHYGVQNKLNEFSQGNDSISTYYTKLKTVWDEIDGVDMNPICPCTCNCGSKANQMKFKEDQRGGGFKKDNNSAPGNDAVSGNNNNYQNGYKGNNFNPNFQKQQWFCLFCNKPRHKTGKCTIL